MFGTGHKVRALELLSICVWLLTRSGTILGRENGPGVIKVVVKEGSDAVLPCLISTKENIIAKIFDWRKVGQKGPKEVFLYESGIHYNNGRPGQDEQFIGQVSHFQDQLKNGNASIKISNTKVTDSGNYSCDFPRLQPRQTFYIELVVEPTFKDRSGEIPGACPEPYIKILKDTKDGLLLQCEVRGASLEPKVMWQDSAGNILPAEEKVTERGGLYYATVQTTVTKSDHYRCVVKQEDIGHWTDAETFVPFYEKPDIIGWLFGGIVIGAVLLAVVLAVVLAVLVATRCITVTCNRRYLLVKMLPTDDPENDSSGPCLPGTDYKPPAETESQSSA